MNRLFLSITAEGIPVRPFTWHWSPGALRRLQAPQGPSPLCIISSPQPHKGQGIPLEYHCQLGFMEFLEGSSCSSVSRSRSSTIAPSKRTTVCQAPCWMCCKHYPIPNIFSPSEESGHSFIIPVEGKEVQRTKHTQDSMTKWQVRFPTGFLIPPLPVLKLLQKENILKVRVYLCFTSIG